MEKAAASTIWNKTRERTASLIIRTTLWILTTVVRLPSYYMLLSCLHLSTTTAAASTSTSATAIERVPKYTCTAYTNTPCTIAHQRYKILPREIALISRRMLFPFYTIIIHHLSDKIDPIWCVRVRVRVRTCVYKEYNLDTVWAVNHFPWIFVFVLLLLFWFQSLFQK